MTKHARTLERNATVSHRARCESTTTAIQSAVVDAITQIQRATEAECATQKVTLDKYFEQLAESLRADLDNSPGAQRIQHEILNGVHDGSATLATVPILCDASVSFV
jgi:hypothetical protein